MTDRPWGAVNPNSTHQRWSRWVFVVQAAQRLPSMRICCDVFRRYARARFQTTVGRAAVRINGARRRYQFVVELEGPPVHDPAYRAMIRRDFADRFVAPGFGPAARLVRIETTLLAGSAEDGRPARQLLVLPTHLSAGKGANGL